MTAFSDTTLLRAAELMVVLFLSLVLLVFSGGEGRRVLRFWAGAGVAFAVREATAMRVERAADGLLLRELWPWPFISQFAEHMVLVMLVCGAIELRRRGTVPRRALLLVLGVGALLALAVVGAPELTVRQALSWRGAIAITCATSMLVAMALVRQAHEEGSPLGRRVLAVTLVALAAERLLAGYHSLAGFRGWPTSAWLGLAPMVELSLIVVGLVATVVVLLEREQAETEVRRLAADRAEQALQSSDSWFRQLIDGASDIITVIDEESVIRFESPAVERTLGWGAEDSVGQPAIRLVHPDDQAVVAAAIEGVLTRRVQIGKAKYRYRAKDGSYRVLESAGKEMAGAGGARRFVVNSRDVTERDELEHRLMHAGKLETVGRLAGGVAHDFNNLLTVITANTALARATLSSTDGAVRELDEVAGAAARAARLTAQLLAFSRRQVVALEDVDVNTLTTGLLTMLRRLVGAEVQFRTSLGAGLPPVLADLGQLEQVVTNLVVNARDAMNGRGTVRLTTSRVDVGASDSRAAENEKPGTYVSLRVEDTGPGVSLEARDHLFEPFFTTKERGRGTGLGLATCYGIVTRLGGQIWYEDVAGGGAAFVVRLPAARATVRQDMAPSLPSADAVRGDERILLVEDDAAVRRVTQRILTEFGYAVVVAEDGVHALALLDAMPLPDLVVTDVVMPRLDGLALTAALRQRAPELPIVLVSGYSDHPVALQRAAVVHTRYVSKPFTPLQLLQAMRALLDAQAAAGMGPRAGAGAGVAER